MRQSSQFKVLSYLLSCIRESSISSSRFHCSKALWQRIARLGTAMLILFGVVSGVGSGRLQAQNVTIAPMIQTVPSTVNRIFGTGVLRAPLGVAVDNIGNLYIADTENGVVRRVDAVTGAMSSVAGGDPGSCPNCCPGQTDSFGDGCPANDAMIYPQGLVLDQAGNLYIADAFHNLVRKVNAATGIISIFAGGGTGCPGQTDSFGDGCPATSAQLSIWPNGVLAGLVVDGAGNVYISDFSNGLVRKVNSQTGIITIAAGGGQLRTGDVYCSGETDGYGDGCPATQAYLGAPQGLAMDIQGNLYIADSKFQIQVIRKVNAQTGIISIVAGGGTGTCTGTDGAGDGCPATNYQFGNPAAVAPDSAGNLYITDAQFNRVDKVNAATGVITAFVGNYTSSPGLNGDGGAAILAGLMGPTGIALDAVGNLYIADTGDNVIREVNTTPLNAGQVPVNTSVIVFPVILSVNTALTLSSVQASGDYSAAGLGTAYLNSDTDQQ